MGFLFKEWLQQMEKEEKEKSVNGSVKQAGQKYNDH